MGVLLDRLAEMAGGALPPPAMPPDPGEITAMADPEARAQRLLAMIVGGDDQKCVYDVDFKVSWNICHFGNNCGHVGCRNAVVIQARGMGTELVRYDLFYAQVFGRPGLETERGPRYVLAWNSTTEPDGTRKCYALRVPPWTPTTCHAIAWTFGRAPHGWYPAVET